MASVTEDKFFCFFEIILLIFFLTGGLLAIPDEAVASDPIQTLANEIRRMKVYAPDEKNLKAYLVLLKKHTNIEFGKCLDAYPYFTNQKWDALFLENVTTGKLVGFAIAKYQGEIDLAEFPEKSKAYPEIDRIIVMLDFLPARGSLNAKDPVLFVSANQKSGVYCLAVGYQIIYKNKSMAKKKIGENAAAGLLKLFEKKFPISPPNRGPELITKIAPKYPIIARRKKLQGKVVLSFLINVEGNVSHVEVKETSGYHVLDQAAIKCVKNWRYRPAVKSWRNIESRINCPIVFKLE